MSEWHKSLLVSVYLAAFVYLTSCWLIHILFRLGFFLFDSPQYLSAWAPLFSATLWPVWCALAFYLAALFGQFHFFLYKKKKEHNL